MGNLLKTSISILLIAAGIHLIITSIWKKPGVIETPHDQYDIIIVGGGSSGCVIARRLWEATNLSIVVVEAGTTASWVSTLPILAPGLQGKSADWAYKTVAQKYSHYGFIKRQSLWPRGKVLGGSSVLNYMLHMWGIPTDFDDYWAVAAGPTWNFKSVLPFFQKAEKVLKTPVSARRGQNGIMPVSEFDYNSSSVAYAFLKGAETLGIKIGDLNGELEDGTMPSQSNIDAGVRVSDFDAYLKPILKEDSKLHILPNTHVTKILIKDNAALGVVTSNSVTGKSHRIMATREVIISAGVIGTPQLLMLSGIGPRKHLQNLSIPVIADIPGVGQSLWDHLNVPLYFHLEQPLSITTTKIKSISNIFKYLTVGKGYIAHSGVEAMARLPVPGSYASHSKLSFMLFNMGSVNHDLFMAISNFRNQSFLETFPESQNDSKEGFLLLTSCTHLQSKGNILLSSPDPFSPPLIDPNYLRKAEDLKCLTKAIQMGAKLGSTKPLRKLGARLHLPHYSHCSNQSLENTLYLECWIRTSAITSFHPVGTCPMGLNDNPMAVVDPKLRVRGIRQLRIIDSSVFPRPTSGNPHAAVLMVAEKGAQIMLTDFRAKYKNN